MYKHSDQLARRARRLEAEAELAVASKVDGLNATASGSPSKKNRQLLLDPIRRWNSFHNSRDRKCQGQALPYLQTLEQFRRQHVSQGTRSSDVFASICAEVARDPSYMPMVPQGYESLEKVSRVLGTNVANELIALSLANLKESFGRSPTRRHMIDITEHTPRTRRTSSDSCQPDRYPAAKQIAKTFSTSNPEDLPNQVVSVPKLSVSQSPSVATTKALPRVHALRSETSDLLASSPLSSSLPSDVGLSPPSAPQLPRRRFSVW